MQVQDTQDSVDNFLNNPSFQMLIFLQSALGREGAALKLNKDGSVRNTGTQLLGLRNSLKNDIIFDI